VLALLVGCRLFVRVVPERERGVVSAESCECGVQVGVDAVDVVVWVGRLSRVALKEEAAGVVVA
jgi:hypothetical protein